VENIMRGELYLPRNMSSVAKDLAKNILVVDPNMRLEIADIKQHKFFRGIQWDLIAARKIKPPFIPPTPRAELSSASYQGIVSDPPSLSNASPNL
jgi:hypothetical protein